MTNCPSIREGAQSGRVIYVDAVVRETIYLIAAFAKNVKENLSDAERNILSDMVKKLKGE